MDQLYIGCSDGRIAASATTLLEGVGAADAARVVVPGGPLQLTRPGNERRVLLDWIGGLLESHDIRIVYLVSHQHCLAYERALGGLGFDQQELLERDLRRAKTLLETTFTGVEVQCYVIPWSENGNGAAFGPAIPVD